MPTAAALMVGVNVCEPVLFTQLDNDVLVGVAHDGENVIDTLSRNRLMQALRGLS
jgi:hypothetical protein